ncbi:uncharacterized protein PHACADRAFT_263232 [Phanerochaete carnosa HHB-10118-sp]|uniref:Uncharacterized protein n=1 Tax=Phanerochaete carnosa (strain HHB-10118-sp) TaxID=650164 RepID=K5VIU6_PHACS|nr:uncharacterized protein PHACADRAFT_263232 [Phanerochaete carnosa HHB-10118-sp]EKM51213.1 hypothetical protein PHACADRAFT_263232 [Phanerochaete carnosa HHB-10118-sp]
MGSIISSLRGSDSFFLSLLGHTLYVVLWPIGFVLGAGWIVACLTAAGCWMIVRLPFVLAYDCFRLCRKAWKSHKRGHTATKPTERVKERPLATEVDEKQTSQAPKIQPAASPKPNLTIDTTGLRGSGLPPIHRSLRSRLFH